MTAPSRLLGLDIEINGRAQKALRPAASAALTLATTYAPFITYTGGVAAANGGQWLDIGNAPGVSVVVAFTHGATPETCSILPIYGVVADGVYTADPTIGAPPPSIVQADITAGVAVAYPGSFTISKTNWSTTTSPLSSATVKYGSVYIFANGYRLLSLYGAVNSITNAPTAVIYVTPGTQG